MRSTFHELVIDERLLATADASEGRVSPEAPLEPCNPPLPRFTALASPPEMKAIMQVTRDAFKFSHIRQMN